MSLTSSVPFDSFSAAALQSNSPMQTRFVLSTTLVAFSLGAILPAVPAQPPAAPPSAPALLPLPYQAPLPQALAPLTIETIMRGPEIYGNKPESVTWSLDSSRVYFRWKAPTEPVRAPVSWFVVERDAKNAAPRKLTVDEVRNDITPLLSGELTRDGKRLVFVQNDDLWLMEAGVPGKKQLTRTPADSEGSPRWTKDETRVTYTRGGNLYVLYVPRGKDGTKSDNAAPAVVQLTNITQPQTGDNSAGNGAANAGGAGRGGRQGFGGAQNRGGAGQNGGATSGDTEKAVRERQQELFGYLRDRNSAAAAARENDAPRRGGNDNSESRGPKPWTPAPNQIVGDLLLAPDETQILARVGERGGGTAPQTGIVPEWITETGRVGSQTGRPVVGQAENRAARYVLLNAATGAAILIAPPESLKDKALSFGDAQWSEDGALLVVSARTFDNHDRFLFLVDRATGKTSTLQNSRDEAWIGGPGAGSWGWMPDNARVWCISETGGWAHLATVSISGGGETPINTGAFEITSAELNRSKTAWFFTSSETNLGERHFWTMPAESDGWASRKQITNQPGIEAATVSPDEKSLAVLSSYVNRPPELFVQDNKTGSTPRRVTVSPPTLFATYPWRDAPTITFPARDGATVYARLYTPSAKAAGKGPAVVFVHGAGYLQNAHRGWSQYEHEYLFHNFLADRGYTVLDVDYRGSSGYGRNVRTAIYKHMGSVDLTDAEDGAKWLVQNQSVDAKRIGIYGGSYGGFLTLMALFTEPDTWACGAALRPVTDWSQYNQGYTANILGLPQDDYAPYRASSPIYYAQNLKGGLLICHGMEDSNVFFADTVRLTQRLIELGKNNWSVAMYPVEDHTFTEPASWTDEFKRIFNLFEMYLK